MKPFRGSSAVGASLALLLFLSGLCACAARGGFVHGFDTALHSQFIDYGYGKLTSAQAAFVAAKYRVVSLEKCTSSTNTEAAITSTAAQLKAIDPTVKVLFYWAVDQQGIWCYSSQATLLANPSWWLRDDAGALVNVSSSGPGALSPRIDWTVPAARAWWVSVPLSAPGAARVIDGVLADGTGSRCPAAGIAPARCAALVAAKSVMVRALQDALDAANGGSVLGNGLDVYPGGPPDNNMYTLADMDGIMGEHYAVFESVKADGGLDVDRVALFISLVANASAQNKNVVVATWPGPIVTPFTDGWPSWPNNTQPADLAGWRAALLDKHRFALAAFLTVAEANVWQQYEGWYDGFTQGAIACPQAPETCAAPAGWYPQLEQPLGPPAGPAVRAGNVWTRHFLHATSVLDLDAPGNSGVTFF